MTTQTTTKKPKDAPAIPDSLPEPPALSNRYRSKLGNGEGGGRVWCIVGKRSRDELEDFDFPDGKEADARQRLGKFQDVWKKQHTSI